MEEAKFIKTLIYFVLFLSVQNVDPSPATYNKITYKIPDKRPLKKALGLNEDIYLNFTELANKYNYPSEEHEITTDDGYILTAFRILSKCNGAPKGFPVLLLHGINDNADTWILAGPQLGLGYVLADNCYDVWFGNHRGNNYCRRHVKLDADKDLEFWNYSFEEHGVFDLPATIDYILNATQKLKVNYIGHSQGTTNFFAMTSLKPEYNSKVQLSIQLAPIVWMKYTYSPLIRLIALFTKEIKYALDSSGYSEFLAKHQLVHAILEYLCHYEPELICGTVLYSSTGYKRNTISSKSLSVGFGHTFSGVSSKELAHFGQLITSQKFQRYDYEAENIKKYGSAKPPEYNVTRTTSPVVLICGENDWLSSLKDVNILKSKLPNVLEYYVVPDPTFSHNSLLWSDEAPKYVYSKILKHLNANNSSSRK